MQNISNYYERLVADQIWLFARSYQDQLSQTFFEDVACLALNQLPPCYVRNIVDKSAYVTPQEQSKMEEVVAEAVKQAIIKVMNNPRQHRED